MEIIVENCKNISESNVHIEENKLNIKYGINGTGKSTIAQAIALSVRGDTEMNSLIPFKFKGSQIDPTKKPNVKGTQAIKSIEIFNEEFLNTVVFKEDDAIENSFEIFVKTNEYESQMLEIEKALSEIRKTFEDNKDLDIIIQDLGELSQCFGTPTKQSSYGGASPIGKSIAKGNPLLNIRDELKGYTPFLHSKVPGQWIEWVSKGKPYMELSHTCPYCTSPSEDKKDMIKAVETEYNSTNLKHLNNVRSVVEKLSKYFSPETNQAFADLFGSAVEISDEGKGFLNTLKSSIDGLRDKLLALKQMSYFSLTESDKIVAKINDLKINLNVYIQLNSEETQKIVNPLNSALTKVADQANEVQNNIKKQQSLIETTIQKHKVEINDFLKYAGYRYSIDIVWKDEKFRTLIRHNDSEAPFTKGDEYFSYGERNAFAIILFMYHCLKHNPDLIILDDPISSFDKNKKFALIEALFLKEGSLKNKTVLLLTHDIEPIIDIIYTKKGLFKDNTTASFLDYRSGKVAEVKISHSDISSITKICLEILESSEDDLIKLVYLRRLLEVSEAKNLGYELISNLLKSRPLEKLKILESNKWRQMTAEEVIQGTAILREWMPTFDYAQLLARISDQKHMLDLYQKSGSRHSKLQLFRLLEKRHENEVITKFLNETFHIENDYIMQLNPIKYDSVPQYIIEECDKILFPATT